MVFYVRSFGAVAAALSEAGWRGRQVVAKLAREPWCTGVYGRVPPFGRLG